MSLKVNLYQERRRQNDNYGKIYGRAKNAEPIGIDELAKHMNEHNTPFSKGVIKGIITDMASCIKELILMGQPVKLADLGIFKASVVSTPANTPKDFDLSKNIKSVKLLCQATGEITRKKLTEGAMLEYTELASKVREGRVDISTLYDEEDDDNNSGNSGSGDDSGEPDPVRP